MLLKCSIKYPTPSILSVRPDQVVHLGINEKFSDLQLIVDFLFNTPKNLILITIFPCSYEQIECESGLPSKIHHHGIQGKLINIYNAPKYCIFDKKIFVVNP